MTGSYLRSQIQIWAGQWVPVERMAHHGAEIADVEMVVDIGDSVVRRREPSRVTALAWS